MRYSLVEYHAGGDHYERHESTIRDARKRARTILHTDRRVLYIIIRKDGVPIEQAFRVYNMRRNSTRVDIKKLEG